MQEPLNLQMTESDARCKLAESHNDVLCRLFDNVHASHFDPFVFLEDVPESVLVNFGLATTGFLGIQNFENFFDELKESEIEDILEGTFSLRTLSAEEVKNLTKDVKPSAIKTKNGVTKIKLHRVQDGSYSIVTKHGKSTLVLKTDPVAFYTNNPNHKITIKDMFHMVRNNAAHSIAYKTNGGVVFFTDQGYIEVSRMWFRGYSELFAKEKTVFDVNKAREILNQEIASGNELSNFDDVKKALSAIKGCFNKNILENYFRVVNFVNYRLQYQENFYNIKTTDKVEILIQILEKNPSYLTGSKETINPRLIYNIKQITALELMARDSRAQLSVESKLHEEYKELMARKENMEKRLARVLETDNKALRRVLQRDFDQLCRDIDSFNTRYANSTKMESADMTLYDSSDSIYLPVEMAVNIVSLMTFNSLVTSGFYEDTLSGTNFNQLSAAQNKFFDNINLDGITYYYKNKPLSTPYSAKDKCFILSAIRAAVCHSFINYRLPSLKQGETADFRNAEVVFELDRDEIKIVATVEDLYKIFSSEAFFKSRPESVLTKPSQMMATELPETHFKLSKYAKGEKPKANTNDDN